MASMHRRYSGSRRLGNGLAAALLIGLLVLAGSAGLVSAQARDPGVAVIFLVDESLSSAAIAQGEKETLYNTVRFLNGALAMACQPGQCQTGVIRFSAGPAQLVPLKPVEEWNERDFLRLEIGIQDRVDQSDFPTAFQEACRQMRQSADTDGKLIVVLTDGQVGSQTSPEIAPVQRARATSRAAFIEEIESAIENCSDDDVRLMTVLLDPNDLIDQPVVEEGAGSDSGQSYRDQERQIWSDWSESSGGVILEAPDADDAQAVRDVVSSLGEILGLAMPEFVMPEGDRLDLGIVAPYRGSVLFEIIGLKPFRVEAESPDGREVPADQISRSQNRVNINFPLPKEGQWVGKLLDPMSDNLFLVRPPVTYPMRLRLYLTQPIDSDEFFEIPPNGKVTLELKAIPVGGNTPVVFDSTIISGTLISPLGLDQPITFTADSTINSYVSIMQFSGTRPEPGLHIIEIPPQLISDLSLEAFREKFTLTDEPFISSWGLIGGGDAISATDPVSFTIDLANADLLSGIATFQIVWGMGNDELLQDPMRLWMLDGDTYVIETVPPSNVNGTVAIQLREGVTKQNRSYRGSPTPPKTFKIFIPSAAPNEIGVSSTEPISATTHTPVPGSEPRDIGKDRTGTGMQLRLNATVAWIVIVVGLVFLVSSLLWYLWPGRFELSRGRKPARSYHIVLGLVRRQRLMRLRRRLFFRGDTDSEVLQQGDLNEAYKDFIEDLPTIAKEEFYDQRRLSKLKEILNGLGSQSKSSANDDRRKRWWEMIKTLTDDEHSLLREMATREFDESAEKRVFSSPLQLFAEASENGSIQEFRKHWKKR